MILHDKNRTGMERGNDVQVMREHKAFLRYYSQVTIENLSSFPLKNKTSSLSPAEIWWKKHKKSSALSKSSAPRWKRLFYPDEETLSSPLVPRPPWIYIFVSPPPRNRIFLLPSPLFPLFSLLSSNHKPSHPPFSVQSSSFPLSHGIFFFLLARC